MLKHLRAGRQGGSRFRNDGGRQVHAFVDLFAQAFAGDERGNKVGAALLHQVKRFIGNKRAVLDGIDSGQDGALGAFIAVCVSCGFAA